MLRDPVDVMVKYAQVVCAGSLNKLDPCVRNSLSMNVAMVEVGIHSFSLSLSLSQPFPAILRNIP